MVFCTFEAPIKHQLIAVTVRVKVRFWMVKSFCIGEIKYQKKYLVLIISSHLLVCCAASARQFTAWMDGVIITSSKHVWCAAIVYKSQTPALYETKHRETIDNTFRAINVRKLMCVYSGSCGYLWARWCGEQPDLSIDVILQTLRDARSVHARARRLIRIGFRQSVVRGERERAWYVGWGRSRCCCCCCCWAERCGGGQNERTDRSN